MMVWLSELTFSMKTCGGSVSSCSQRAFTRATFGSVPVNMTASIIYEDVREVATVGILSDLRERIRIEQRLLQAQEKLLITEKQVERSVFLLAEPWVQPMTRPFYAVGKAESAGTENSSLPIDLIIVPNTKEAAR